MLPYNFNYWKTDPEYIDLLIYVIEKTENVKSPLNISQLARDFKAKSRAAQTEKCLKHRITTLRPIIHSLEHIKTDTKVRMLYALGASVNGAFLQELSNDAHVKVDGKNRITHYKSDRLELEGYHCLLTRDTNNYLTTDEKGSDLLNYLIKETENVESPMNISQLARDFKEHSGTFKTTDSLQKRIKRVSAVIHRYEHIDKSTKVKLLFALSAPVDPNFLEELKERAFVEVDEMNRITYYEAIIDGLELSGDHSHSEKQKTALFESKRSLLGMINGYFENKDDVDPVPTNEEEKEMWNLIKFITEKCENIRSPQSISRLAEDFNQHFGIWKATRTIQDRIKRYCQAIQKVEFLDTASTVKQLFGLSATVDPNYLEKLREEAVVEVDSYNRIIEYTSNDGSLRLNGRHLGLKMAPLQYVDRMNSSKRVLTDSDEDDEEYHPKFKTPKSSKRKADNWESSLSKRTRDYNPFYSFKDQPRFELQKFPGYMDKLLDDYDQNYSIDNRVKLEPFRGSLQENLKGIEQDEDIQQIPRPLQVHDEHNQVEELSIKEEQEEPIENSTEPLEVKPVQKLDKHNELTEVPVKIEHEEPVEVKPETSHNSKIRFFETMQSLILCLDTPSLFSIQSKIHQKVQKLKGSDEVVLNNVMVLIIDLLVSQITNHSVENHSENVESINLSNFFCYLKASLLNSKMCGLEGLVRNISKLIEESQNKRIPTEKVENALRATLDVEGF